MRIKLGIRQELILEGPKKMYRLLTRALDYKGYSSRGILFALIEVMPIEFHPDNLVGIESKPTDSFQMHQRFIEQTEEVELGPVKIKATYICREKVGIEFMGLMGEWTVEVKGLR